MTLFDLFRRKKETEDKTIEPVKGPYWACDWVILNEDIEYQGIGGKKAYIEISLTLNDVLEQLQSFNISAKNFYERRPDLFKKNAFDNIDENIDTIAKKKASKLGYYYVKVWQHDERYGTYLGYIVASDEFDKIMPGGETNENSI